MTAEIVYVLCALTSSLCAALLWVNFKRTGFKLLLWSGLCFVGLALSNIGLLADRVLFPDVDFSLVRTIPALAGVAILVWGFIWDTA